MPKEEAISSGARPVAGEKLAAETLITVRSDEAGRTRRTRLLPLSAMIIFPAGSKATLVGKDRAVPTGAVPSPLKPATPKPATVVMTPVLRVILRMQWLLRSA